jgi:hypothetical protein
MNPVLRRIAINGGLTALVLGIIGLMFAELASMWLISSMATQSKGKASPPDTSVFRQRLPLFMAIAGFSFVAIGELVLHRVRKNRKPPAAPTPSQTDQTEKLLQELLAKEEAKMAAAPRGVAPSPPTSENTATPPPPGHPEVGK